MALLCKTHQMTLSTFRAASPELQGQGPADRQLLGVQQPPPAMPAGAPCGGLGSSARLSSRTLGRKFWKDTC